MTAAGRMRGISPASLSPIHIMAGACLLLMLAGCDLLPPSRPVPAEMQSPNFRPPPLTTLSPDTPTPEAVNTPSATQIPNCTNDLEFLADLSIPDGTQLNPLKGFDKEWKVRNSGTCNWTDAYSVKLVSGPELGVEPTQPLVYTLNGAEAVISISFTAPIEPGRYTSTWRAVAPDGVPFGEWFSVEFIVTNP